ncbi:MAG: hypothetical protein OES38_09370 [Gammaproteobacteria bacterium]|nr:hypothetical protein [Gammaproteobacteria bacterium]
MSLRSLQKHLEENFHPAAAGTIDATFRLAIDGQTDEEVLTFHVNHGVLEFAASRSSLEARAQACDATFYFADTDTAWALLSGQGDAFQAFMDGQFRADGYLMWAFTLMAMFRATGPTAEKRD